MTAESEKKEKSLALAGQEWLCEEKLYQFVQTMSGFTPINGTTVSSGFVIALRMTPTKNMHLLIQPGTEYVLCIMHQARHGNVPGALSLLFCLAPSWPQIQGQTMIPSSSGAVGVRIANLDGEKEVQGQQVVRGNEQSSTRAYKGT